jgi:hypothetical protein
MNNKGSVRFINFIAQITSIIIVVAVVTVTLTECVGSHKDIPYDGLALLIGTVLVPITGLKAWEKKIENNA